MDEVQTAQKKSPSYTESWHSLYGGDQTITRAEYYRRTEKSERPYSDDGIQKHNFRVRAL
jgi:hypothetical protein